MAVSAGFALVTAATTAAAAGGTAAAIAANVTFLGFQGFAALTAQFLVSTALGAALNALTPKPSVGARGYNVTQTGSALDHQIIYGTAKCGAVRIFDTTTGKKNKFLHRVLAFAAHEIEEFEEIYVNDELVTLDVGGNVTSPAKYDGKIRINKHLGASDQAADADLISEVEDWTSNHRLRGIAYLYVRLKFSDKAFPNGVPEISAVIKGKKVYDPRTEATVWSDNPALCIRDYLTNNSYGMGEEYDNIDDEKVIAAANVCDLTDTPDSSTRYTCNGNFTTATVPADSLSSLLTSMGGLLWYGQGKWRMKAASWVAPDLTLDEDDLRSSITVSTRHSRRDNYNTVKGTFRGEESNWQITDYPEVSNQAFLDADNGQESSIDLALPFTDTSVEARRIARVALERNRQQLTVQASFGLEAFQLQVGDNVYITNSRFGWTSKPFEITSWTFGVVGEYDLQVNMTIRETAESIFDDIDDGVVYERDNTTLLSPFEVPSIGLELTAVAHVRSEKLLNSLEVRVTANEEERVDLVEVQFKKSSEDDTLYKDLGSGELGIFEAVDLDRADYDVRARAINTFGVKGDYVTSGDFTVDALSDPPADVTNFTKNLSGGTLFLNWSPVADLDLSYYQIKRFPGTTGGSWATSNVVVEKVARPGTSVAIPGQSGTYFIRAYDKGGNPSENATSLVVLPSELPQLGTSQEQVEDPTFSGTKTNVSVDTTPTPDELIVTDLSAATPQGTYEFSNYIDTASSRTVRVTGEVTFNRHQPTAGTWDAIPQNWETWPGNWDQWDSEQANFADHSVTIYVATTNDDPSGSPTWSSWSLAEGEFTARAFKFKAELNSNNTGVSPSVETLKATVEY